MTRRLPLWLLPLLAACHAPRPALQDLDYPGALRSPTALAVELVWQQQVTASWRQGPDGAAQERAFTAAVQRHGDTLTVLGLSPLGEVGFSIEQRPDGIDVQNHMQEHLRIPPRFILLDVQRVFYPWLPAGVLVADVDGEQVTERFADGRLQRRTFRRLDDEPAGLIEITYEWQNADWRAPTRAVLHNGWFGYTLTIETTAEQRL